jgi:hypothetical protein
MVRVRVIILFLGEGSAIRNSFDLQHQELRINAKRVSMVMLEIVV